ncbi:putative outer membrane protein [Streptomyces sp. SAI-041]|nr:putative outer membrane protein [Streptomyces sp. SAI-041]
MLVSRKAAGTLIMGGAVATTLASLLYPAMLGVQKVSTAQDRVIATPATGALTEADRDFVVKVRAAALWEYPVGRMTLQKSRTKAVKTAGEHLIDGAASLDAACRHAAGLLDITLPNQSSPQQQSFVFQLNAESGERFDRDMVTLVRAANGQILSTIANVRTTTRNSLIRALADRANDTVLEHITVMEKTGLVDFDQVVVQETTPPELPARDLTPPPPVAGQPQVVLPSPPNSAVSPSPSAGR